MKSVALDPQSPVVFAGTPGATSAPGQPSTPTTVHPGAEQVDAQAKVVYTIAPA